MPLTNPIFRRISRLAEEQGVRAFVVGGYVRDHFLRRPSTDIDVVVVGSGIALAEALGRITPEMGAAAQRRINEHFLWQNSAELALTLLPAKGNRHG